MPERALGGPRTCRGVTRASGAERDTRRTLPDLRLPGPASVWPAGTPAAPGLSAAGGGGTEPGARQCEMWPLALGGPMTGTHGVCVRDVLQRRSSSQCRAWSRQGTRVSLAGDGGTGSTGLGRAVDVAGTRVVPPEVTGVVQPGRPSVSPNTPA